MSLSASICPVVRVLCLVCPVRLFYIVSLSVMACVSQYVACLCLCLYVPRVCLSLWSLSVPFVGVCRVYRPRGTSRRRRQPADLAIEWCRCRGAGARAGGGRADDLCVCLPVTAAPGASGTVPLHSARSTCHWRSAEIGCEELWRSARPGVVRALTVAPSVAVPGPARADDT